MRLLTFSDPLQGLECEGAAPPGHSLLPAKKMDHLLSRPGMTPQWTPYRVESHRLVMLECDPRGWSRPMSLKDQCVTEKSFSIAGRPRAQE